MAEVELIARERVRQLKSLDRYERRALSRRRSATRAFDHNGYMVRVQPRE